MSDEGFKGSKHGTERERPEPAEHQGSGAEAAPFTPIPDTEDEEYEEVLEEAQGKWIYAWVMASLAFVSLVVPLSILLLPYTPSAVVRRSSVTSWETVPPPTLPADHKDEDPHNCRAQLAQDDRKPLPDTSGSKEFTPDFSTRQHRRLFCVFDTKHQRTSVPYLPKNVPYSYCTAILYYSLSLWESGVYYKRPNVDPVYIEEFNKLKSQGKLQRGSGTPLPLLLTVGGDVSDARNISRALRTEGSQTLAKSMLVELCAYHDCQGINLHWEYATSPCGHPDDGKHLATFFDLLSKWKSTSNPSFILAVTVAAEAIRRSSLKTYLAKVDHVLVLTHTAASRRSVVECSGGAFEAAAAASRITATFKGADDKKVCFSVSVGADVYIAQEPAVGARVRANWTGSSLSLVQRGKMGLYQACRLSPVSTGQQGCSASYRAVGATYVVATYLTPEQVHDRMRVLYEAQQGGTCLAIFDMDLDDFSGICGRPFGQQSPLTAAILSA